MLLVVKRMDILENENLLLWYQWESQWEKAKLGDMEYESSTIHHMLCEGRPNELFFGVALPTRAAWKMMPKASPSIPADCDRGLEPCLKHLKPIESPPRKCLMHSVWDSRSPDPHS
jgi:hypothetical protein